MRLAVRIAYDGRAFYGHQRQPDARTVEGECIRALRDAGIIRDVRSAFFRSASRTDRGVSAVGNVIAFDSLLRADAVPGAFNDRARDVWAWAIASVPDGFHPRHAVERWYRYHLFRAASLARLREAGAAFVGEHDFRWFTSDPPAGPFTVRRVDVARAAGLVTVDVRAQSFRRGMVRRIVAAMVACAEGRADVGTVREALRGQRHDFGSVPPEPLFLMEVSYDFPFEPAARGKALDEWRERFEDSVLRERWVRYLRTASVHEPRLGPRRKGHAGRLSGTERK